MTQEEVDNLEKGDIIQFPPNSGWKSKGQIFVLDRIDRVNNRYYVTSYQGSKTGPNGYWMIMYIKECSLIEKCRVRSRARDHAHPQYIEHRCPICSSIGDDLVFSFYCSNKQCQNYKK